MTERRGSLFREEALRHAAAVRGGGDGDVIRLSPAWTRWAYWLLVAAFTAGALFIVFGLALLEVVELRPPAALQGLTSRRSGGTAGVLFMGLTFVIAAFTCTAPFIGTVLVAAAGATTGAQWFRPILGMAVFALALALPFFLLALFPGWLARLPRSGAYTLRVAAQGYTPGTVTVTAPSAVPVQITLTP